MTLSFSATSALAAKPVQEPQQILMVLSSYGEKGADGKLIKPGYEFDEMSKSYLVFDAAGAEVTFASPKGGKPIADKFDKNKPYNQKFLEDTTAVKLLSASVKLSDINSQAFDAVYVVGGKGPMFDLATNKDVKTIIKQVYENKGVVGAVCHGPAALLDVKLSNGNYLIADKRISAFTNQEEKAFTKKWQLPFMLADKLTAQGASYQQDGLMLNQVSVDKRLVTGQNPFSTADAAKALVAELGLPVPAHIDFKDDRTIKLAEAFFADRASAALAYKNNTEQYDTMLLAMIGLYQAKHATRQIELDVGLALMELTQAKVNHPMLETAIAQAYLDKSDTHTAMKRLQTSKNKFPDNAQIANLLLELSQ
ncbi:type 1 glutamine amidotransferase domain-containing protein [Thalassotalea euphylliae]|nr:type 1 glutamine amidotransferase domain-containing protein [Thalassotalea euphylliae]